LRYRPLADRSGFPHSPGSPPSSIPPIRHHWSRHAPGWGKMPTWRLQSPGPMADTVPARAMGAEVAPLGVDNPPGEERNSAQVAPPGIPRGPGGPPEVARRMQTPGSQQGEPWPQWTMGRAEGHNAEGLYQVRKAAQQAGRPSAGRGPG
jgi:hypothetical protein